MTALILDVTDANYADTVSASTLPVLIDFWAPWCAPCKALAPLIDKTAEHYEGRLQVVKINVDEAPELAQRFQVRGIPTLLLLKQDEVVARPEGITRTRLHAQLDEHLA
jgi:thioredoxin 1